MGPCRGADERGGGRERHHTNLWHGLGSAARDQGADAQTRIPLERLSSARGVSRGRRARAGWMRAAAYEGGSGQAYAPCARRAEYMTGNPPALLPTPRPPPDSPRPSSWPTAPWPTPFTHTKGFEKSLHPCIRIFVSARTI